MPFWVYLGSTGIYTTLVLRQQLVMDCLRGVERQVALTKQDEFPVAGLLQSPSHEVLSCLGQLVRTPFRLYPLLNLSPKEDTFLRVRCTRPGIQRDSMANNALLRCQSVSFLVPVKLDKAYAERLKLRVQ